MSEARPLVAIAVVCFYLIARVRRARRLVAQWAARNGSTIVKRHWVFFKLSPWPLVGLGKQTFRYLWVRDSQGRVRRCWLLLGQFLWGLTDRIEVVCESQAVVCCKNRERLAT